MNPPKGIHCVRAKIYLTVRKTIRTGVKINKIFIYSIAGSSDQIVKHIFMLSFNGLKLLQGFSRVTYKKNKSKILNIIIIIYYLKRGLYIR